MIEYRKCMSATAKWTDGVYHGCWTAERAMRGEGQLEREQAAQVKELRVAVPSSGR